MCKTLCAMTDPSTIWMMLSSVPLWRGMCWLSLNRERKGCEGTNVVVSDNYDVRESVSVQTGQ